MPGDLQGVKNFREFAHDYAPGLFFRGGNLAHATAADTAYLNSLGIGRIIDLRCGWERDAAPDAPVKGALNTHIPYYDAQIVGLEYTHSAPGTIRIGHDIACEPKHFYSSLANPKTARQIARAIHLALDTAAEGTPVYIHCSGGKDRAGVTCAVILQTLGAAPDKIAADYELTNISRDANTKEPLARFLTLAQGDADLAQKLFDDHRANAKNLDYFREGAAALYGSYDTFTTRVLGLDDAYVTTVRRQIESAAQKQRGVA